MSSKKQGKQKQTPILLGFPDVPIEDDNDAYVTKLGGLPNWLSPETRPSRKVCHCKLCKRPMYLIFQSYVPLPASIFHRVLYVWACNRRACMRKEGSFSIVRSHMVDKDLLRAKRQKEAEKRKKEEKKKNAKAAPTSFQLGDLWGSSGSFGGGNTTGGFGTNATGGFGTNTTGGFGMKPAAPKPEASMASIVKKSIEEDLSTKIEKLSLDTITDPIDTSELPQFPGHYLYIDEEVLESPETMQDMSRYQQYIDMETELLMDTDEGWQGETYEKSSLPKGVDKDFKRFTERVEYAPSQCVRYDHHGKPLLYAGLQKQHQQIINSTCGACGGPRSFEFQLMPPILSILPTVDVAAAEDDVKQVKSGNNIKDALDSWNVGMEFGTILAFTCQKDCHPADDENVTFVEEALIVQYETD